MSLISLKSVRDTFGKSNTKEILRTYGQQSLIGCWEQKLKKKNPRIKAVGLKKRLMVISL